MVDQASPPRPVNPAGLPDFPSGAASDFGAIQARWRASNQIAQSAIRRPIARRHLFNVAASVGGSYFDVTA